MKSQTPRQAKRGRDTKIPQSGGPPKKVGEIEAVPSKEMGDRKEGAATICYLARSSKHDIGLIFQGEGSTVLVEPHHKPTAAPSTSPPHISSTLRSPIRQETEVPQLSSPPHTNVADEAASTGVDVRHRGAATIVTSLDAGQGSGNINKTPSMPCDSPLPRDHTLGSDEDRMQQNELMNLVIKLSDRCEALETELRQTNWKRISKKKTQSEAKRTKPSMGLERA
ncbi:hypothetical protein Tco_0557130 [Tanacetum coccineum]